MKHRARRTVGEVAKEIVGKTSKDLRPVVVKPAEELCHAMILEVLGIRALASTFVQDAQIL